MGQGLEGVKRAATLGFRLLDQGRSAITAVEAAVVEMEDNPLFNAGTGATLNLAGYVEADAGVMDGRTRRGAGVALIRHVKNPVRLARIVMANTDHALIAGDSAERLAGVFGLPRANLRTPERVRMWKQARRNLGKTTLNELPRNQKLLRKNGLGFLGDTVGALAIDQNRNLAAADSTGGVFLKLPGRVGDSPLLGAGLYADNSTGAATATGLGEIAMRLVVSKLACDAMSMFSAQVAANKTIARVTKLAGKGLGMITLDREGRYGVAHNTPHLCWAAYTSKRGLVSGMSRKPARRESSVS
jgi:beta-aspartyl-peptidase (threonine type)